MTIIVRDDDTPPLAVGNLRAQAGNTEATLRWNAPAAPTPDHGQPILHYEYRVKVGTGSFGAWTMVPNSDATTTSHKFTGLTNETEYTYEVRAENVAGDGAEDDVSVTPRVGVAVSFGAATASITEGGSSAVTVTLDEAPATGVTVVVPITPTRGEGLKASEYSGVPASVTFAEGDTSKSFTVTVADDALDEPDETLTLELGTLPSGYVPGTNAEIAITVVDDDVAEWALTLRDSGGNDVTELTEGGASATARVSITNSVRFETDQEIVLQWLGLTLATTRGLIQGANGGTTITITAGQSSGTLAVSAPQRTGDLYRPPLTATLVALREGSQVGDGIELTYIDDEDPPELTIGLRDTRVVEGGTVYLDGTLSRGYDLSSIHRHAVATGATTRLPALALNAVNGQPAAPLTFLQSGQTTSHPFSMTTTGNTTAGDHATITFTIPPDPDVYTIGTPSTATLLILDDDDAPGAPRNPAARPGDTEATLGWDHPSTYDQVWVSDYQYRRRAGTGPWTGWAVVPDSDGETTGHTFTGLTNEIEYTFEIRGRNSNHNGAVAQVMGHAEGGPGGPIEHRDAPGRRGRVRRLLRRARHRAPPPLSPSSFREGATSPPNPTPCASQPPTGTSGRGSPSTPDRTAMPTTTPWPSRTRYPEAAPLNTSRSPMRPIVQVTVDDDDVPPPPVRGFTAADESQDAVALSWWSERGAAEYELEYRKQGDTGAWTPVTRGDFDHLPSTTGNRSLTGIATGLECETTYDFRIRLRGSGDILLDAFGPHTEVSRTTGECAQPNKPTNLMYTLDPDCATLTWTAPTGGDYTGVRIRRLTLGDEKWKLIHERLNSRPTRYEDCTNTGDDYGDGDNPEYAYRVTYVKFESGLLVESKHAKSGFDQYGPALQDHHHADPRNVRLTRDTDSQRRMAWDAPPSASLNIWAGLQGASVPVDDPWINGYLVERREFMTRPDDYFYFTEAAEDLTLWDATMTVGESSDATRVGYSREANNRFGSLSQDTFNHVAGRYRVLDVWYRPSRLQLSLSETPPAHAAGDWDLVINGDRFPLADALIDPNGFTLISWIASGISWTNGQQVSVQLVDRDRYGWKRVRPGRNDDTSTSFTDNERANGRKFVYRVRTTNRYGASTTHSIFDWLWDNPYRDAVIDLAATDTTVDDSGGGNTGNTGQQNPPANSEPTGKPTIGGTPQVGQTLTASTSSITDADGLTNAAFNYRWIAGGSDISGATSSTYTLTSSEQGKTVQVRVTFTDDAANQETLTSTATLAVAAPAPLTASLPNSRFQSARHNGTDDRPQVIVAFSLPVASFEKTTPSVSLTGATLSSVRQHQEVGLENAWIFFLNPDADGHILLSLLTGQPCDSGGICTEDGGTLSGGMQVPLPGPEEQEEPDDPNSPATGAPTIGGTPQVDQTLTANTSAIQDADGLQNVSYQYQWLAAGSAITGATGSNYQLTAAQQGKTIQVRVTFTDDADNGETLTSAATVAVAAPTPLTAAFQDLPNSHDGSTAFTFRVLFSEDVGVSYVNMRNDAFTVEEGDVTSARRVGGRNDLWEITVEPDGNTDVVITLPADRSCTTAGAVCTKEDNPRQLTNSPTATVTGPAEEPPTNTSAAGAPTISGTSQVEQTLTADTSSITDEDGLTSVSYSYQWLAGGSAISGATGSTYTLTNSEQGQTVQVRVSFTDDADNGETLTSAATVAVAAKPNTPATGAPAISGTPQVEQTLTASTSGINDQDGLENVSYSYQWIGRRIRHQRSHRRQLHPHHHPGGRHHQGAGDLRGRRRQRRVPDQRGHRLRQGKARVRSPQRFQQRAGQPRRQHRPSPSTSRSARTSGRATPASGTTPSPSTRAT